MNMQCCFKLRKVATEAHKICESCVFYCFTRFREGLEDLGNVPGIQWLSTAQNPETVAKVYELVIKRPSDYPKIVSVILG
jgi:hypothetical protein